MRGSKENAAKSKEEIRKIGIEIEEAEVLAQIDDRGEIDEEVIKKALLRAFVYGIYDNDFRYVKFGLEHIKNGDLGSIITSDLDKVRKGGGEELTEAGEVFGE